MSPCTKEPSSEVAGSINITSHSNGLSPCRKELSSELAGSINIMANTSKACAGMIKKKTL